MTSAPSLYPTRDRSPTRSAPSADGAYFDPAKAAAAVAWVEKFCRHSIGEWAGRPYLLDPNARQMFEDIYGWRRYADGARLYREVFDAEARKNGKSTKASALALALAIADGEPRAQVYSIAGNAEQASLVFDEAKMMVAQSPQLSRETETLAKVIYCPRLHSFFRPLTAKAGTKHGLNPHGVIGDEVHEWAGREQYDVMHTAVGARRQPLEFYITTAGDNLESLCWEQWEYALKVRDGLEVNPAFLPIIFAADKDDDPGDPATWAKANPNLGVAKKLDAMQRAYDEALAKPSAMNSFKRLHLNIWTEAHDKLWPIDVLKAAENAAPFDENELIGRPCWFGLDLAWKQDFTALIAAFPPAGADPCWRIVPRFWVAEHGLAERAKRDRVPMDIWAAKGLLKLTPGNVTDFDMVEAGIRETWAKFKPVAMGFDRIFAGPTINHLTDDGFKCEEVGQGFMSFAMPMAELDRCLHARTFRHGGNPIWMWMASNVVAETDAAGNMKPSKKRSIQRIDGVPATLNAMALALAARAQPQNPYERRGLIVLR